MAISNNQFAGDVWQEPASSAKAGCLWGQERFCVCSDAELKVATSHPIINGWQPQFYELLNQNILRISLTFLNLVGSVTAKPPMKTGVRRVAGTGGTQVGGVHGFLL